MKNKSDNYDLTQPSISGKPGFDLFHSQQSGEYFFHFNDVSGAPLLFSEGYSGSDGRDNGVRSLIENAGDEKRYKINREKSGFFFAVKAKNHREIARSKHFPDKASLEKALEYVRSKVPKENIPNSSAAPKTAAEIPKTSKPAAKNAPAPVPKAEVQPLTAPKYLFKIDLYPRSEEKKVNGKIYSAINDKSLNFNGLDMDAIAGFIKSQLPAEMVALLEKKTEPVLKTNETKPIEPANTPAMTEEMKEMQVKKTQKPETVITVKDAEIRSLKGKVIGKLQMETLQIQVHPEGNPLPSISLPVLTPLKLELKLVKGAENLIPGGVKIPMELNLKSLPDNHMFSLGSFQISSDALDGIEAPFSFRLPHQGVFRLIARSKSASKTEQIEGSLLVSAT